VLRKRKLMPKTITLDVLRLTRSGYCPTAKLITVGELFDFKKITMRVALTHFLTAGEIEVDGSS
jgi:phenylacetic acid degradation operon negative regulatory protein